MEGQSRKILVFIPTYNEKDNVLLIYEKIKNLSCNTDILYCDDNSPDGTGKVIDDLVNKDKTIHVLHRKGKLGTGTAIREGYKFARKNGYDLLITMDADLTHDPNYIPLMIENLDIENADIVIGSRYADGGKMSGWNSIRLPLTYFWRNMIKYGLGLPFDATGAFRLYRVPVLQEAIYTEFTSQGFANCMESIYKFKQHGASISEVPIHAISRIHGESKLSPAIMKEVAKKFFVLLIDRIFYRRPKALIRTDER